MNNLPAFREIVQSEYVAFLAHFSEDDQLYRSLCASLLFDIQAQTVADDRKLVAGPCHKQRRDCLWKCSQATINVMIELILRKIFTHLICVNLFFDNATIQNRKSHY